MAGEDKPVVLALAVDEEERVSVQLTATEAEAKPECAGECRSVQVKLKVDKAGYVHVTLETSSLHKPSWAKHQFKKLLHVLTHKHHKKGKGGDTHSPSDKTEVQSPATPQKSPFWKIGSRVRTPTAQQA